MNKIRVCVIRDEAYITFKLTPFVTEWDKVRQAFISGIVNHFDNMSLSDISTSLSAELSDSWCKYRIFGGSSTILLKPDSLRLTFPNLLITDYPTAVEIIRFGVDSLLPMFDCYNQHSYILISNRHVDLLDGGSRMYLEQFAHNSMQCAVEFEPKMRYKPSASFTLENENRNRVLRRSVEQSEILNNGLFLATSIFVLDNTLNEFDDECHWVERIYELADISIGIEFEMEDVDEVSGI